MGIALPPPIAPQLASIEVVQAQGPEVATFQYEGLRLHIRGLKPDKPGRMQADIRAAQTVSDAVLAIGYRYFIDGYPAARVHYAVSGPSDLEISVRPGRISRVDGPESLKHQFDDLTRRKQLTAAALESDREVADPLAERAGQQYKLNLIADGDDAAVLDIGTPVDTVPRYTAIVDFANSGNRYAGPYIASAGLRGAFASGTEATVGASTSVRGIGIDGDKSQAFLRGDGGLSQVTRWGVFGLEGQSVSYHPVGQLAVYDGGRVGGAVSWLLPLYADFHTRVNWQSRVERNWESITNPAGRRVLGEQYNSVAGVLTLLHRVPVGSNTLEMQSDTTVRKGLSPADTTTTRASLGYFLVQPSLELRLGLGQHWIPFISAAGQFSNSTVPQAQQYVIGGPTTASAFESGSAVGDRGEAFRSGVEWHGLPDSWAERYKLRVKVFAEYASATLARDDLNFGAGSVELGDAGFSIEAQPIRWAQLKLNYAQPFLTDNFQPGAEPVRRVLSFDVMARF